MMKKILVLLLPLALCAMDGQFDGEWSDGGMALQIYGDDLGELPGYDFGVSLPELQDQDSQGFLEDGASGSGEGAGKSQVAELPLAATVSKRKRKIYLCEESSCRESFSDKRYLDDHNRRKHNAPLLECDQCSQKFTKYFNHWYHMSQHKKGTVSCTYCGVKFSSQGYLEDHKRQEHGEPLLQCDQCLETFTYNRTYRLHMQTCNGSLVDSAVVDASVSATEYKGKSKCCNEVFTSWAYLCDHGRKCHGYPLLKCRKCFRSFEKYHTHRCHEIRCNGSLEAGASGVDTNASASKPRQKRARG